MADRGCGVRTGPGTGEGFYSLAHRQRSLSHFVRGAGILKSTDGGQTWNQLPGTDTWQAVTRIVVSPADSNLPMPATGLVMPEHLPVLRLGVQ
jgi:hypothetical protein